MQTRRSIRRYRGDPLELPQLSQILWSAHGITVTRGYREAPSAGATYHLELFVFIAK
jgi:nitroreductase